MRHTALWLPMIAFLLQPSLSPARAQQSTTPPTLTVTGTADVRVAPDQAVVQFGVDTRGSTAQEAMFKNNVLMTQIVDALKKLGIPDDNGKDILQTSNINLSPVYDTSSTNDPPRLVGFDSNNVLIAMLEIAKLGPAIDAAVSGGANQIQGISFQLADDQQYKLQALQAAGASARAKANALAAGLNVTITSVLNVTESVVQVTPANRGTVAPVPAGTNVPVLPGELIVEAQVQVEFGIK